MRSAISAEIFKVRHRRMTYILLGALVGLVGLFYFVLWLRVRQGPEPRLRGLVQYQGLLDSMAFANVEPYGLQYVRTFGTVVAVIFAGMMTGNEYDWGTAAHVISRGTPRLHFLTSKMLICLGFVVVVVTVGLLAAGTASAWLSYLYGLPFGDYGLSRVGQTLASEGRTVFVILPFVFMAVLFATLLRSAGQAVGITLGFFFLETLFTAVLGNATGFVSHIPDALLNVNIGVIMRLNGTVGGGLLTGGADAATNEPSVWRAASLLAAYVVVFSAVALWRFRKRDLV